MRDRRRRIDRASGVLLAPEERWVTLSPTEGLVVHGDARRTEATARLRDARPRVSERFWPTWPPREHELCPEARVRTALRWGRHAAVAALGGGGGAASPIAGEAIPQEPYAQLPRGTRSVAATSTTVHGEPVWMYRLHHRDYERDSDGGSRSDECEED